MWARDSLRPEVSGDRRQTSKDCVRHTVCGRLCAGDCVLQTVCRTQSAALLCTKHRAQCTVRSATHKQQTGAHTAQGTEQSAASCKSFSVVSATHCMRHTVCTLHSNTPTLTHSLCTELCTLAQSSNSAFSQRSHGQNFSLLFFSSSSLPACLFASLFASLSLCLSLSDELERQQFRHLPSRRPLTVCWRWRPKGTLGQRNCKLGAKNLFASPVWPA